jgi:FtsP/CotA-like multicopper oxidase with cupredoxin domain
MSDLTNTSEEGGAEAAIGKETNGDTTVPNESRRNLFKLALGAGAVALATSKESIAVSGDDNLPPSVVYPPSPTIAAIHWWKESIPAYVYQPKAPVADLNPPVQQAANVGSGECGRNDIQRYDTLYEEGYGIDQYELHVKEAMHQFTPAYPVQPIWGYDGMYPGPTFHARYGVPIITRLFNELPQNHVGYGSPEISMHLHNMHTPSESDGFPADYWSPNKFGPTLTGSGLYKDHCYHNVYAGYDNSRDPNHPDYLGPEAIGDPREALGTLWYHDHTLDSTGANVVKGLAGFYIIYDNIDSGNENLDPNNPNALRLPSGDFDVPLMFQDMRFDANGKQFYDQMSPEGVVGDMVIVNGKIKPYFNVQPRKYRLRLLNGGPTRFYEFSLVQGGVAKPFTHIANDGNLLEYPRMNQTKIKLAMAERRDIIVDFSVFKGKEVFLVNTQLQTDTRKPADSSTIAAGNQVLKFKVGTGAVADPSRVLTATTKLRNLPPIDLTKVAQRRTFVFGRNNGVWTVNGKIFNVNDIQAKPKKDTAEIWTLINDGGGWDHPIHVHFEEGRVLTRNGRAPNLDERGRKDVFNLPPNERVEVYFQFRDFTGKYIIHCHNLVHEDHAMMLRWDIVD